MRTIIAGSRHIEKIEHVCIAIARSGFEQHITSVVCGGARGIDNMGDIWAQVMGLPVNYFLVSTDDRIDYSHYHNLVPDGEGGYRNVTIASDWKIDGTFAGPKRNMAMAENADALILVPLKGDRKGSNSMKRVAGLKGLLIFEWEVEG